MTTTAPVPVTTARTEGIRYGGLIVLMLMGFLLVTAEFLPNGVLTEMADAREASRSYEANLRVFEQARQMSSSLLELLRR